MAEVFAAETSGGMAVSYGGPLDHAACDAEIIRLQVRYDDAVHEVTRRIARECERRGNALPPSDERNAWLSAAGVALAVRDQERDDEKEAGRG